MSISFGSLGLMSLRNPLADAVGILWGKGDIRSMFWLIVFCIFFLILGECLFSDIYFLNAPQSMLPYLFLTS